MRANWSILTFPHRVGTMKSFVLLQYVIKL